MPVLIRRLEEQDQVEAFDCGDDSLKNYLKRHAKGKPAEELDRRHLCCSRRAAPNVILGYFTLATASVPGDAFPNKYVRGFRRMIR